MIFIITGKQGEGKTTLLQKTTDLLLDRKMPVFGFYAKGEWENGIRSFFRLVDVSTRNKFLLCERSGKGENTKAPFHFYPEALSAGEKAIREGIRQKKQLAVLDEIGRFELEGKVWYPVFKTLLSENIPVLITIRESLVEAVLKHFGIKNYRLFPVNALPEKVADIIYQTVSSKHK